METPPPREKLEEWYDENYFRTYPRHDRRIKRILNNLSFSPSDRICEFGCGLGHILLSLAPGIGRGVGFDCSEFAVADANRRAQIQGLTNISFQAIDIEQLVEHSEYQQQFDAVLMMDISEHLYDDTLLRFFAAARHVLSENGALYIHTPNVGYYLEKMKARNFILKQFPSHIAVRGLKTYEELLGKAGFAIESVKMLPHYNRVLGTLDVLMMNVPYLKQLFMSRILLKARLI